MIIIQKHLEFYENIAQAVNIADSEIADFTADNATTDSFRIKEKIAAQTGDNVAKNVEIMVQLKYLSNFWRTFEISLISCEIDFRQY